MNPTATGGNVSSPRETERREGRVALYSRYYPRISGGICEKCGVVDDKQPSIYQYKLCEHFRPLLGGNNLECSYCDSSKDPSEVMRVSNIFVYDHPYKKDSIGRPVLGAVCDSYNCKTRYNEEFKLFQ